MAMFSPGALLCTIELLRAHPNAMTAAGFLQLGIDDDGRGNRSLATQLV